MGILDDAIREHLELKRQHGAESDDLERLENEAFGPATRPGDPEFSTGESDVAPAATAAPGEPAPEAAAAEAAPSGGFFDYGTEAGESSEWSAPDEEQTRIVPPDPTPAETARVDHPELGETADHPAPPQLEDEPPEAPEHAIFDSGEIDFGDLDLGLEDEPEPEPPAPPPPPPSLSKPLEPIPEVPLADSPFEEDHGDAAPGTGENESSLADAPGPLSPPTDDEELPPPPIPAREGEEEDDEDLLEETPDFLQDAPEGERLWFEQGAPKDFDFDDD
jgi:hypothetical protein